MDMNADPANILYLHMLLRGDTLLKLDSLVDKIGTTTNIYYMGIKERLSHYLFIDNVISKQKHTMRHEIQNSQK